MEARLEITDVRFSKKRPIVHYSALRILGQLQVQSMDNIKSVFWKSDMILDGLYLLEINE